MPIPRDYRDICDMLLKATYQGRVNWIEEGGTVAVKLPEYKFEIWSGTDERDQKRFVAVALRHPSERKLLDSWSLDEDDDGFRELHELFGEAKRHAHRVPEKLSSLRKLLKGESKVGFGEDEEGFPCFKLDEYTTQASG